MNKQRKIVITVTYNDLGCIIATKAEPYEEPNLQPTCNQLAIDCISRQAAIDVLQKCRKHCIDPFDSYHIDIQDAENQLSKLPGAQPVATDTNVGDTISRQAAVELVMKYCPDDDGTVQCDGDIRGLLDELENLPSAQPETATVTIGRTKGGVTMWYECDACGEPVDQKDNYCRNCGRKLKHD